MAARASHFCRIPFEKIEIAANGDVFLCNPGWLQKPAGNLNDSSIEEIWKNETAKALRTSVQDGSFRHCSSEMCPHLQALDSGVNPSPHSPLENAPRKEVPIGPLSVNIAFDLTCNLSCPSCRKETIVARLGSPELQRVEKAASQLIEALPKIGLLKMSGNGDPFASRSYWRVLTAMDRKLHPHLRVILNTNGLLFTADRWKELHKAHGLIDTVEISIDAASAETYALNRRGGSFETLLERLDFIAKLRSENSMRRFVISFVVQTNNFKEMPAFVELGRKLNADAILFHRLANWGSFPEAVFSNRSIHRKDHPKHGEFLEILANPIFAEKDVFLGNLSSLRKT